MNQRKDFLQYFFNGIKDYNYAILKNIYEDIYQLPESADIDLVIDRKELQHFIRIISCGNNVSRIKTDQKSFACFVSIFFTDATYLEIDLIHRFDRKGIIYMDVEDVLKKSEINLQGLKTTALHHQFEYVLLFYLLNHSEMPSRYVRYFTSLQKVEQSVLISYIACKYVVHINNMDELIPFHPHQREKILQKIHRHPENQWSKMLVHKAQYIIDTIKEKVKPTDATITFSGVDGAGKSTILQLVKEQLEYKYHKRVKVLRHRPGILPILSSMKYGKNQAEKKASSSLPRKGTNSSFFSSMGRFLYYYMDYLIGQVYVFFRYQINGNVILYDRYYFDFIIDPRRSNISLKPSFLRLGYSFVVKPEVNFFLYAPAQEILSRKQELSEEDIRTMTSDYQKLFKDLSGKYKEQAYLSINNTNLNTTIESVMKQIIPRL